MKTKKVENVKTTLKVQIGHPFHTGLFLVGVVPEGVFHLHPVTPLSFKSDDSNFV